MTDEKQPLHIKYRANDFDEIIGNKISISVLKSKIESGSKTFLLHGERGCGKTTIARIMCKHLGIKSDRDIYEYDLAEVGKKDKGIELKTASRYGTFSGGSKVYILDECQNATTGFQESILKLIEEPPPKTYFIFCTTNPVKMLSTIKSRCIQVLLSKLDIEESNELIKRVCRMEKIRLTQNEINEIAIKAEGVCREILTLVDSVRDIENKIEFIHQYDQNEREVKELCQALVKKATWKTIAGVIKDLKIEPEQARYAILGYLSAVLLNSGDMRYAEVIEFFKESFMYSKRAGLIQACYFSTKV